MAGLIVCSFNWLLQVSEVEFIKSMTIESKRQLMQQKLEESEARRREHLASIVAKQEELQNKVRIS